MSQGLYENFEVSLVFFFIEFIFIVVLLPLVLSRIDSKKWRPMRIEIISALIACHRRIVMEIDADLKAIFSAYLHQHVHGQSLSRSNNFLQTKRELTRAEHTLRQTVDLLAPAIEPTMAKAVIDLLHLPKEILGDLQDIEENLTDFLNFATAQSAKALSVSDKVRSKILIDTFNISNRIQHAFDDLSSVIFGIIYKRK